MAATLVFTYSAGYRGHWFRLDVYRDVTQLIQMWAVLTDTTTASQLMATSVVMAGGAPTLQEIAKWAATAQAAINSYLGT